MTFDANTRKTTAVDFPENKPTKFIQEPNKKTVGHFDLKFGQVFFKGQAEAVASTLNKSGISISDLDVCPEGEWAAFVSPKDSQTYLIDGKAKAKRLLIKGWSYNLAWIGPAKSPNKKKYE